MSDCSIFLHAEFKTVLFLLSGCDPDIHNCDGYSLQHPGYCQRCSLQVVFFLHLIKSPFLYVNRAKTLPTDQVLCSDFYRFKGSVHWEKYRALTVKQTLAMARVFIEIPEKVGSLLIHFRSSTQIAKLRSFCNWILPVLCTKMPLYKFSQSRNRLQYVR